MSYVCVKPITLLGNNYKPGELIQDGHILPSRERALVRTGCIAEVTGGTELPVAELVQVETGEEVTFSIPGYCGHPRRPGGFAIYIRRSVPPPAANERT